MQSRKVLPKLGKSHTVRREAKVTLRVTGASRKDTQILDPIVHTPHYGSELLRQRLTAPKRYLYT